MGRQQTIEEQVKDLEEVINELQKKRDEEAGGVMKKLEDDLAACQKEDAKAHSTLSARKDAIKAE